MTWITPRAEALTFTWTGLGANSNWATLANWQNSIPPSSGYTNDLIFSGANRKSNVNNFAGTFLMNSLTLNGNSWWLSGNAFGLRGGGFIRSNGIGNLISNNITLSVNGGNQFIDILGGVGNNLTMSGNLSGAGWLRVNDGALLNLNGTNSHAGTSIENGSVGANSASIGNSVYIGDQGTLNWSESANATYSGLIGGTGDLNKLGSGTLTLTAHNSLEGILNIKNGGVILNGIAAMGGGSITLAGANTALTVNQNSDDPDFSLHLEDLVGGSTFTKNGIGTLDAKFISNGVNVNVNEGVLKLGNDAIGHNLTIASPGTLEAWIESGVTATLTGNLFGSGTFRKTGTGDLTWTKAQNSFTGTLSIQDGRVFGDADFFNSQKIQLATNGKLRLTDGIFGGILSGTGSVTLVNTDFRKAQNGWLGQVFINPSGTPSILGPNSVFDKVSSISASHAILDAKTGPLNNQMYLEGSGTFDYDGGNNYSYLLRKGDGTFSGVLNVLSSGISFTTDNFQGSVILPVSTVFGFKQDFNGQFSNTITGDGFFRKEGLGTVSMKGSLLNSFTGYLQVLSGSIKLIDSNWNGKVLADQGTSLILESNLNTNWSGYISGGGDLVKTGSGVLSMTDNSNTGASLQVAQGTLRANNGLVNYWNISTLQPGRFLLSGELAAARANTFTNAGELTGQGRIDAVFNNQATGRVIANANQTIEFQKDATNSGSFQLLGGTLQFDTLLKNLSGSQISGRGVIRTAGVTGGEGLQNSGSIAFSGGFSDVFGDVNNLSGGRLMAVGGSTVTYHDDVIHNGAEIRTAAGSRSVFLGSLSGAGIFSGGGTVEVQGDLRPGNSPAKVTFMGDLELGATSTTNLELGGKTIGAQYDSIDVRGNAYLGGDLHVNLINGFNPGYGDLFLIFQGNKIGEFNNLYLPELTGGMYWDTSGLYSSGTIKSVPEPGTLIALAVGIAGLLRRRARSRKA